MSFGRLSRTTGSRRAVRAGALVAVPSLLALTLAACGGGGGDDESAPPSGDPTDSTNTAGALTLSEEWPLTGEQVQGELPDHPVYVVKIDNTSSSAPQVGLDKADMVVEELVEGGLTRLAVFFYSDIPDNVGPVRSMRASDVGIVKPAAADLVASGAANPTVNVLASAHVVTFTEDASDAAGFYRSDTRVAPYNLFSKLTDLASDPGKGWAAPTDTYLPFGPAGHFTGSIDVKSIAAEFSSGHTTNWTYTPKGWTRPDSYAEAGHDFVADNVLLLRVQIGDAGYRDPAGNPVPETEFYGDGAGVLVNGDHAMKVTWHKKDKGSEITLTNMHGKAVTVPAGHTWIELVPADSGSVSLS